MTPADQSSAAGAPPDDLDPSGTAFFLDFDGTLVDIAARPEDVQLTDATRQALGDLARLTGGAVAIVSGRELADIDGFLAPLALAVAGSHGAEMRTAPDAAVEEAENHAILAHAVDELGAFAAGRGLRLERKRGALSLHYRSHPEAGDAARALVGRIAARSEGLRLIDGNMVAELALAGTDKGRAVARFLDAPPFAGRRPVVAGDDTTDEDAFRAALAHGGIAIKIGAGATAASHRVPDSAAFLDWLARAVARMRDRQQG